MAPIQKPTRALQAMPSSFNPYYTPMKATPCSPFEQAKAHMLDRLSSHGRPDSTHITYLLAHARRATYYIDVARDFREVYRFTRENCDQQRRGPSMHSMRMSRAELQKRLTRALA